MLAQLVVLVWVLAQPADGGFDWLQLAMASLFVQWIVLLSAAALCRLRGWMRRRPLGLAVAACHAVVVGLTLFFTVLGDWVVYRGMTGSLQWEQAVAAPWPDRADHDQPVVALLLSAATVAASTTGRAAFTAAGAAVAYSPALSV
ncbi:hypothetical protein ULG90_14825 [Halopseudomonas pachastrellae]|nr:hypothetical protein ULG90_14825 [Halopseudomonas pachastrellae]